ncbi:MAG: sigma-70 family RNA polymerase sigma factor, partial [Gammaproteobacteria bacterium]
MTDPWSTDEVRWSAWMVDAQRGDRHTYTQLLEELATAIHGYIAKRFWGDEFVDDCVQECLLAIHQARHTYDGDRAFRPWLFAIVRHRIIDMLRSRNSYRRALGRAAEEATSIETTAVVREAGDVLAALEPNHRDALVLTKLLGLSTREAAA